MMCIRKIIFLFSFFTLSVVNAYAQEVPTRGENLKCLITFGKNGDPSWGDDDFSQTFFFVIPVIQKMPVYIRVYDPDVFGDFDEFNGEPDTKVKFSVYGGKEAYSNLDARALSPKGNYQSGVMLASKVFGNEKEYNLKWYTFGPFNPTEGELSNELGGYVFKVIAEGLNGNDGNNYKYFLSSKMNDNNPIEGGNAFTYEYSFRLQDEVGSVAHIYPFADNNVASININNFDFDNDGFIKIYSIKKNGHDIAFSGNNVWAKSNVIISEAEKNKSLDVQLVKSGNAINDMVFYVTNQYNVPVPFFTVPLGGVPKYQYSIKITPNGAQK
ncbi:MAG: hypothetical protein IPP32_15385 [Bacteroidetes bacterium]|nr:hypothetical protein [Bacteroidota bacterium]